MDLREVFGFSYPCADVTLLNPQFLRIAFQWEKSPRHRYLRYSDLHGWSELRA